MEPVKIDIGDPVGAGKTLPLNRLVGNETGGCPHTVIREAASMNSAAVQDMVKQHPDLQMVFIESGAGYLGGDRYGRDIEVDAGASLLPGPFWSSSRTSWSPDGGRFSFDEFRRRTDVFVDGRLEVPDHVLIQPGATDVDGMSFLGGEKPLPARRIVATFGAVALPHLCAGMTLCDTANGLLMMRMHSSAVSAVFVSILTIGLFLLVWAAATLVHRHRTSLEIPRVSE